MKISDIRPGMERINLVAKVVYVGQVRQVDTRFGPATVVTTIIDDGTGRIKLKLWRDQMASVESGRTIKLENAFASIYGGELELSIGKKGNITVLNMS